MKNSLRYKRSTRSSSLSIGIVFVCVCQILSTCLCGCSSLQKRKNTPKPHSGDELITYAQGEKLPFLSSSFSSDLYLTTYFDVNDSIAPDVVGYSDYRDPLITLNRFFFACNNVLYRFFLIPLSTTYTHIMPEFAEKGVNNFFNNINSPASAFNHVLQGNPKQALKTLFRFGFNSTIGLLGFFDPAKVWLKLERHTTHVEDTISHYGFGYGFYLVLPVLGPSDLRNGISAVAEMFLNPVRYFTDEPITTAILSVDYIQQFAPRASDYNTLRLKSDDPYIFFRNLYLQGKKRDEEY